MTTDTSLSQGAYKITPAGPLKGTIQAPGDKSISHRAVMLASLANGASTIEGFLESGDCVATLRAFQQMGIHSERVGHTIRIDGAGLRGLREPDDVLDMGNSGTGARLLLGVLAGQPFASTLTGDESLRSRPMRRVTEPLARMGAQFIGRENNEKLPLTVRGGSLTGFEYESPVASAQVKSAILLAGLFADGETAVREPGPSRDHTERMLETFGATLDREDRRCALRGGQELKGCDVNVPGDISSAAFFLVAASIVPDSELVIQDVGVNPTRTGILDVLCDMGADITLENERAYGAEPVADLRVRYAPLQGVRVVGDRVVRMIDEFPIFAVAAAFASSPSTVEEAHELRVKESDRISAIVEEFGRFGIEMSEREDGFTVAGNAAPRGCAGSSRGDHRIAMSLTVCGLAARGETIVRGTAPISTSFPNFFDLLQQITPGSVEGIE